METTEKLGVKERLIQFISYKKLNVNRFQISIGVSNSYIRNMNSGIGVDIIRKIQNVYPELNIDWLTSGEGKMIVQPSGIALANGSKIISVLPLSLQGGKLSAFIDSVTEIDCEKMISPIDGAELALTVAGDSMSPEYPNGSRIVIKKIDETAFIDYGKPFVLDTCNGIIFKNVFPGSVGTRIRCSSVNKNYPDYEVQTADIYGWYRVLLNMAAK